MRVRVREREKKLAWEGVGVFALQSGVWNFCGGVERALRERGVGDGSKIRICLSM